MAKKAPKYSPQPAPPHLAGAGAVPSSSSDGPSGKRGAVHSEAAPRTICFKCAARPPMPGYRVCAYCFEVWAACFEEPPRHEEDESFPCGCAWNTDRFVTLNLGPGPFLVPRPPDPSCVTCRGTGKIKDRYHHLEAGGSVLLEFGFHLDEKAGSTGEDPGRPVQGVVGADAIRQQLERTWHEFEDLLELHLLETQSLSMKAHWREFSALLIALSGDRLNDDATAAALGFSRKTFHNRDKRGRETFAALIEYVAEHAFTQNPRMGGGTMNATTTLERIESKVDALRAELRAEHDEIFRVLWAFRHGETPAESWERLLAEDEAA